LEAAYWQALIPVTAGEEQAEPVTSDALDPELVYVILIIFVSVWIVMGIGCGIYLVYIRNRVRVK